ncbi:hypothetical protein N8933_07250 [Pseudomonadales bacterium]|nr:hypothetical protein [Pseudomonadales bacterium]
MNKSEVSEIPEALMTWLSDPRVLLVFAIVLSTMMVNFVVRRGFDRLYAKAESTTTIWDDALLASVRKPLRLMIWVVGVGWAAEMIAKQSASGFEEIINPLRYVLVLGILVYFLVRFIREVEKGLVHNGSDATTTHAVGKLLRVSVIVTAVLSILQTLGHQYFGYSGLRWVWRNCCWVRGKRLVSKLFWRAYDLSRSPVCVRRLDSQP